MRATAFPMVGTPWATLVPLVVSFGLAAWWSRPTGGAVHRRLAGSAFPRASATTRPAGGVGRAGAEVASRYVGIRARMAMRAGVAPRAVVAARSMLRRPARNRALSGELADAALLVELVRTACASGCSVRSGVVLALAHAPARLEGAMHLRRLRDPLARGAPFNTTLEAWSAVTGQLGTEIATVLRNADRTGAGVVEPLSRLGVDLRRRRRRHLESRARRLPVTMLVPLVVCVLPAFVVLTVGPMLVVGLTSLSTGP